MFNRILFQLFIILIVFCEMLLANDIVIELNTGKNTYVENEPIYFDLLVVNSSNNMIKMAEPLKIGWGGYTFKNLTTGIYVTDLPIYGEWEGTQPLLLPKSAERNIGTIQSALINKLLPDTNYRYLVSVTKKFIIDDKLTEIESNPVEITILQKSKSDSELIAELSKIGNLNPQDNSIGCSLFGLLKNDYSYNRYDSALIVLRKYKNSSYFPYFVSYILRIYTPIQNSKLNNKNSDFLLSFLDNNETEFAKSDKYLNIMHMSRIANNYLNSVIDNQELKKIGQKYKKSLTDKFSDEPKEKYNNKKDIITHFDIVDVLVSPGKVNKINRKAIKDQN